MANAIAEVNRRREVQEKYNEKFGIKPKTIQKAIGISDLPQSKSNKTKFRDISYTSPVEYDLDNDEILTSYRAQKLIEQLNKALEKAIKGMQFNRALLLRQKIQRVKKSL